MKKVSFCAALFLLAVFICFSCKKDDSCAGCGAGNTVQTIKHQPIINAGLDITAAAGCNTAWLEGSVKSSDPSPSILWKQVSGPTQSAILSPNKLSTLLTNITAGTYRYVLQVTDTHGSASDTAVLTVSNAKELIVDNLQWQNLVDDIVHVWAVDINRPDLFCDTLRIKEIAINDRGSWLTVQPHWKGPGIAAFVSGTSAGGYYYEHFLTDGLKIYRYGNIWDLHTAARIIFN